MEGNFVVQAFTKGGPVMFVIALIGVVVIYLIFERYFALKKQSINKKEFIDTLFAMVLRGEVRQAIAFCESRPTPITNTIKSGLVQVLNGRSDEEIQVAMDAAILRETPKIVGWSSFLAVLGNIGVLTGLLGTIIGMIISFDAISKESDPQEKGIRLSEGISHALYATGFGLSVAITAIVAFGIFQMIIQKAEDELIESSMTFMNIVANNRDKMKVN